MAKKISDFQRSEIARLTRLANRRLERATGGQRSYLEYAVEKATGAKKFSAATKGLTFTQAQAKLHELYKFVDYKGSTKAGWEELKAISVERANETLSNMGYNLTDEELADILKQLDTNKRSEFYRAVNLVEAAKQAAGDKWEGRTEQIADAIKEKADNQEALQRALEAREARRSGK